MNKVSTAVQLRFDVRGSNSLPEEVKTRLTLLVRQASEKPKLRKKTRPTGGASLRVKAYRSSAKRWRQQDAGDWDE